MDPVSIVGVAAAAIQFYTFTISTVSSTWRATATSRGLVAEANDFEAVSARFKEMIERLDKQLQAMDTNVEGMHLSETDLFLQRVCADCLPKFKSLHAASSKLANKLGQKNQGQVFLQALEAEFKQGDIEALNDTLSKLRDEIVTAMIASLWDSVKGTQHATSALSAQITALHQTVLEIANSGLSRPDASEFVKDIEATEMLRSQSVLDTVDWNDGRLESVWHDLKQEFSNRSWPREPMDTSQTNSQWHLRLAKDIVSKLKFDKMATRHDAITRPHESTFEWIWHAEPAISGASQQPKWSSFPAWLEGSSITPYWVTGRPGAGKSTLMRFIEGHRNLQYHLSQWNSELRLRILSYYAWNPGSDRQKSVEGLVRTILFQLLESEPHLLPMVLPRRWAFATATGSSAYPTDFEAQDMEQVEDGLMCLLSTVQPSLKLMILVDGLDEFDVAPKEVIRTIESISKYGNVKLCVASRPWNEFEDSFESWPSLRIHELTANDIGKFTHEKFLKSKAARRRPIEAEHLRAEIQKNAAGVFQWVTVVVNFILDKLESGDPFQDILNILHHLPDQLGDLYTAIWKRLDKARREQATEVFMLESNARHRSSLSYIELWCINERHSSVSGIELLKGTAKDPQAIRDIVVRFLNSRTLGLLELDSHGTVTFLHRTIPEWLEANKILAQSALQAHLYSLQGLCVIGGHIAPLHEQFGFMLLCFVAHHLAALVSFDMLSDMTQDIVNWLRELEQSAIPPDVRGLRELSIIGYASDKFGVVDLAALCGFIPYVKSHLESNRRLPRKHLFESCVALVDHRNLMLHERPPARESFERKWDLLRLCLEHGVTPYEYDTKSVTKKECSLKLVAQVYRRCADDPGSFGAPSLNEQEVTEYCTQVAVIIESSSDCKKQVLLRFKENVSSPFVNLKRRMRAW